MSSVIVLEDVNEVVTLVSSWHENNLWLLEQRLKASDCLQEQAVLQQVIALIEPLPFTTLVVAKDT